MHFANAAADRDQSSHHAKRDGYRHTERDGYHDVRTVRATDGLSL